MKTNCWLILGTMLATTAVAQVNQPKPTAPATHAAAVPVAPATPAPAVPAAPVPPVPPVITPEAPSSDIKTNAPAKKTLKAKKKAVKKEHAAKHEEKATEKAGKPGDKISVKNEEKKALEAEALPTLVPGSATVTGAAVNLRGQAGLNGEVVGHVKKGDTVTVLAEINLDKPKAGEPAKWAKISLPVSEKVWVNAKYVDATNNVIMAKKLNLRGGPGENFSVLGVVEKGASVTPVITKGEWMQIQTPASAFAFISANLLKQEGAAPAITPVAVLTPTPTPVLEAPMIVPHVVAPPPVMMPPPVAPVMPVMTMPTPTPVLVPDNDTNPPPRIVTHEGSVRDSVSPVAPSYFELFDPENDKAIDYLYTSSTNLNLARYNGMHITVTGEEAMDPRWKDTPVLTIKEIHVISAPKPKVQPKK